MKIFDKFCCEISQRQLTYTCDQHGINCPDVVLRYSEGLVESKINILPNFHLISPNAAYECSFCPWCGTNMKEFYKI